jgi:hypothetical protein
MGQRYPGFYGSGQLFTFMEVYRLCVRSYDNLDPGQQLDELGAKWEVEHAWEEGNFAAYAIKKPGSWNALVFRGTDGKGDWLGDNIPNALGNGHPPQYKRGREIAAAHGAGRVLLGHSLGGGIATYASAHHGIAAATIFPAPVIPSRLPESGAKANVQNYVCHGEVLTEATQVGRSGNFFRDAAQTVINWKISGRQHRRLGQDFWVQSNGGNPGTKHLLGNLVTN